MLTNKVDKMKLRKLKFILDDQEKSFLRSANEDLEEKIQSLRVPSRYRGFIVEYDQYMNIVTVNGKNVDTFLTENKDFTKERLNGLFHYRAMPDIINGNLIKVNAYAVATPPPDTNAVSVESLTKDLSDFVRRESFTFLFNENYFRDGEFVDEKENIEQNSAKIQKVIDVFEYYTEEDPQSRMFQHLILEIEHFAKTGEQLPLHRNGFHKSLKFIYKYDFETVEDFRNLLYQVARSPEDYPQD